jgi:hypothetical protein
VIPISLVEKAFFDRNYLRQVKIVKDYASVIDPQQPGIEPAADIDNNTLRTPL